MIKQRAVDAVRTILVAASYDVEEGTENIDLTAYRGNECLVALCSDDTSDIDEFLRKRFRVQLDDCVSDCKKLLFTMKADEITADSGCTVWGHRELAKYAGQAVVADLLGEVLALEFDASSGPSKKADEGFSPAPGQDFGPELSCLPQSVSEERARQIAGVRGEVRRLYIPHYLYSCESTGEKVFKSHVIDFNLKESGLINAITGSKSEIESDRLCDVVPEKKNVPADAKISDPKLKKADVIESIQERVTGSLSKSVRVSKSEGDTIFYEDIKVSPEKENIKIDVDLVYLPVIQVRGDRVIEVDTFSGGLLREPMDDGVELL